MTHRCGCCFEFIEIGRGRKERDADEGDIQEA